MMITGKQFISAVDVSTRAKRRKAMSLVIDLLEHIRFAEEANIERFPINLQESEAFAKAEYSTDMIIEAIVYLMDAYG